MENWWRVRHQHQYLKMMSRPRLKEKQELMRCPQESVSNNSLSIWLVFGVILLILFHSTHSTVVACLSNHPSIYLSVCLSVIHSIYCTQTDHPSVHVAICCICLHVSPSVSICTHFALMKFNTQNVSPIIIQCLTFSGYIYPLFQSVHQCRSTLLLTVTSTTCTCIYSYINCFSVFCQSFSIFPVPFILLHPFFLLFFFAYRKSLSKSRNYIFHFFLEMPKGRCTFPLSSLALTRSGDKGNHVNIGVLLHLSFWQCSCLLACLLAHSLACLLACVLVCLIACLHASLCTCSYLYVHTYLLKLTVLLTFSCLVLSFMLVLQL